MPYTSPPLPPLTFPTIDTLPRHQHYERGLLWAQIYQGGHALPASQPRVAYRHVEWMLGHIDEL
jgi:carboxypeptidase D